MERFEQTYSYKLIYVFSMPYETHKGMLKVGEATLKTDIMPNELVPNCRALNQAAKARIDSYTKTASISYKLEYTELAVKKDSGFVFSFKDKDVHKVLMNSGVHKVQPNGATGEEWFATDLATVKAAIKAVKEGRNSLSSGDIVRAISDVAIDFREEQINAIERTLNIFKKDDEMLWYAKMRFGKTLTALEVIRRSQFRRVIIVTHRPVVDDGWSEDFKKIFFSGNSKHEYHYERKTKDSSYKASKKKKDVVVNGQGLSDEQIEHIDDTEPSNLSSPLTPEELEIRKKKKQAKEARKRAIDILRGISIRMPLMIYGADVSIEEDIDINSFVHIVDNESWKEFMPKGVTKEIFARFTKYYDRDVFIAAGKRIRKLAAAADRETPTRRVIQIAEIFRHFKNPDKETVLTPWRVVNMHMSETIGGWCFFNEKFEDDTSKEKHRLEEPRFVDCGEVTKSVFAESAKILEINSKTGLYPLYVAYSFYKQRMEGMSDDDWEPEDCQLFWNEVVRDNVYVICNTPMAKSITRREQNIRCSKWIKRKYVKVPDNIDFYKVFIPKSNGSGAIGEVLSTPVVGQPTVGHALRQWG